MGVVGVGVEDFDDFFDSYGIVVGLLSVKVCGSVDEGVIDFVFNNCLFGWERKMIYLSLVLWVSLVLGMMDMLIMLLFYCWYIRDFVWVEKVGFIVSVSFW